MSGITAVFRQAYKDFSLDVALDLPGRGVTAFFGVSGSGKSTLLRCIAGLERARSGQLVVSGEVWQDDASGVFMPVHRRPLGLVFQDASLFAHLDVRRNLDYGRSRVPAAQRRVSLEQAVELLGIEPLMERRPDTLSGGERQRVAIARALATSPSLLLMDEPLASLDLQRKADVLPYLEKLHAELDIPILYVSHAPDEVARLADHLVLLEAGRVTAAGPTRELMTRLDLPLAHGDAAAAVIEATVTHLEPAWQLSHLEFPGGQISLPSQALQPGQKVRVRIQARDISLSLQRQEGSSVLNVFAAIVTGLADDSPGQLMVSLDAGGSTLLARITRKSAAALQLQPGSAVFAQVKGVAVLG
ncbi:molybdenum ABC transporter ATP-binding protein [Polaromonas eurypsychrophila]|uniref:Molybdenum import ATP-binding protein ModC n=1 Tax=Polaromonas eurypsychrophila TaxID=1614635 RepID=A0A916SMK3_9BURK|nr:molybdenum ABC transporter ATP-binding protein [Polaromonas eurypsychrophila]GGB08340.1 molybdenum import ATP-binding protein ModC [Polaromonas eurypsychrophila]